MLKQYKDCYVEFDEHTFTIGNSCIERRIEITDNIPVSRKIVSKKGNKVWSGKSSTAMFNVVKFDYKNSKVFFHSYDMQVGGRGESALFAELIFETPETVVKQIFYIFPGTNAVSNGLFIKGKTQMPDKSEDAEINTAIECDEPEELRNVNFPFINTVDTLNIYEKHIKLDCIKLYDKTDRNNELYTQHEELLYTKFGKSFGGNIFILKDYLNSEALLVARDSFTEGFGTETTDFYVKPIFHAMIGGNGMIYNDYNDYDDYVFCGGTTIVCSGEQAVLKEYKKFYKKMFGCGHTYVMSNTWGDRSRDKAICAEFVKKEIDLAVCTGADIVQIDDGWQKGISANSGLRTGGVWGDFYASDNDFWAVNTDKFPDGFLEVSEYAKEKGIKLGLWFSLDTTNSYEQWERDANKILELHEKYGVCYFKIDGLVISDFICKNNIEKFIRLTSKKSDGKIELNMDITADRRLGYFLMKQYSTIFVENRYTDWGNYYPHRTLRNLWNLSRVFLPEKFQFEVLNEKRNIDVYDKKDILCPSAYPIDYIFASVMVSNPLLWMELSGLDEQQIQLISDIVSIYRNEREELTKGIVTPIGSCPDGKSYTGFQIELENGTGYLILLKEFCDDNSYVYELQGKEIYQTEVLASNCKEVKLKTSKGNIRVKNMRNAGYVFVKVCCAESERG